MDDGVSKARTSSSTYDDQNFNHVTLVSVDEGVTEVVVTCHGKVETEDNAGVIGQHAGHLPLWAFSARPS